MTNKPLTISGKKEKSICDDTDTITTVKLTKIDLSLKSENRDLNIMLKPGNKILLFTILFSILYLINLKYTGYQQTKKQTSAIILSPQVNDMYFIDFRLLGDEVNKKLRPTEKYRLAKVVDITGDVVTLLYGAFYYQRQRAAIDSIVYGQLRYEKYFDKKRYDIAHSDLLTMHKNKAIYLAKRPIDNKLFGNYISPIETTKSRGEFTPGKKESRQGEALLQDKYNELGAEHAYKLFQQASELGSPQGQVNLASMYLNGTFVDKDLTKALYWFKVASLQAYKPAILKYVIVCKQFAGCDEYDFYKTLYSSGVNIKVRDVEVKSRNLLDSTRL